jgi:hypothetical protein
MFTHYRKYWQMARVLTSYGAEIDGIGEIKNYKRHRFPPDIIQAIFQTFTAQS